MSQIDRGALIIWESRLTAGEEDEHSDDVVLSSGTMEAYCEGVLSGTAEGP